MPWGTDAACGNEAGREGTLTGLAAAGGNSAHILLPVCRWAGTGEPLRSLQPFGYPLQVTHPGNLLPRTSGWFLWSGREAPAMLSMGIPFLGAGASLGKGPRQGQCPGTGSTVGLAELCAADRDSPASAAVGMAAVTLRPSRQPAAAEAQVGGGAPKSPACAPTAQVGGGAPKRHITQCVL